MQKTFSKISATIIAVAIIACGCFSPVTADLEYQPEYLGPIAFANITPEEFAETIEPTGTYSIHPYDLNHPSIQIGVPVDVPPLGPVDLPPKYYDISEIVHSITADKATFDISFVNNLSITISQGTRLVAFDSSNQNNIIFDHSLSEDVEPGESYNNQQEASQKTLKSDLGLQVKDFQSPGGDDVVFEDDSTSITVTLQIVEFLSAQLNPGHSFSYKFTTPVDFSVTDTADDYNISGYLSLFFENKLPANMSMKLSLLNEIGDTTYRFFNGQAMTVEEPPIDGQGMTTMANEVDFPEIVSLDTLQQIKGVKHLHSKITVETPSANTKLKLNDAHYFKITLSTKASAKIDIEE